MVRLNSKLSNLNFPLCPMIIVLREPLQATTEYHRRLFTEKAVPRKSIAKDNVLLCNFKVFFVTVDFKR